MNSCPLFAVIVLAAGIVAITLAPGEAGAAPRAMRVYIGTYTSGTSKGIYTATFDPATGTLSAPQLAAEAKNPSFLAVHPNRRFLYAVGELNTFAGQRTGAVSAFRIEIRFLFRKKN